MQKSMHPNSQIYAFYSIKYTNSHHLRVIAANWRIWPPTVQLHWHYIQNAIIPRFNT